MRLFLIMLLLCLPSKLTDAKPAQMYLRDFCLTRAVYNEARGESLDGQLAVAYVVLNRSQSWHSTVCDVVYQPAQFPHVTQINGVFKTDAWDKANKVVHLAEIGYFKDPSKGGLYYYAPDKVPAPAWVRKLKLTAVIGHHRFYR